MMIIIPVTYSTWGVAPHRASGGVKVTGHGHLPKDVGREREREREMEEGGGGVDPMRSVGGMVFQRFEIFFG